MGQTRATRAVAIALRIAGTEHQCNDVRARVQPGAARFAGSEAGPGKRRPKRAAVPVVCDVQLVVEYYAAR